MLGFLLNVQQYYFQMCVSHQNSPGMSVRMQLRVTFIIESSIDYYFNNLCRKHQKIEKTLITISQKNTRLHFRLVTWLFSRPKRNDINSEWFNNREMQQIFTFEKKKSLLKKFLEFFANKGTSKCFQLMINWSANEHSSSLRSQNKSSKRQN